MTVTAFPRQKGEMGKGQRRCGCWNGTGGGEGNSTLVGSEMVTPQGGKLTLNPYKDFRVRNHFWPCLAHKGLF